MIKTFIKLCDYCSSKDTKICKSCINFIYFVNIKERFLNLEIVKNSKVSTKDEFFKYIQSILYNIFGLIICIKVNTYFKDKNLLIITLFEEDIIDISYIYNKNLQSLEILTKKITTINQLSFNKINSLYDFILNNIHIFSEVRNE